MPCFSKPVVALGLTILAVALSVPIPTGQLDEIPWAPCGTPNNPMMCGDLYFCGGPWGNLTVSPQPPTATAGFAYAYKSTAAGPCIPGASPIIRVQPGYTYKVMFHNTADMDPTFVDPNSALGLNMTTAWDPNQDPTMNLTATPTGFAWWGQLNLPLHVTNLHLHGAHISGMGDHDQVLRPVLPGQCQAYIYNVGEDTPGGMHIYHPHAHGRVAYQFLGGAFGGFIIDDFSTVAANGVGATFNGIGKDLKGKVVDQPVKNFLSFRNLERVLYAYSEFGTRMGNGVSGNLYTGAQMSMTANQWFRWRVLVAKAEGVFGWISFKDTTGLLLTWATTIAPQCEIYELANDGVYLSTVPYRPWAANGTNSQNSFQLHGASRMEFAIRCMTTGTFVIEFEGGPVATVTVLPTPVPNPYPASVASPFAAGGVSQWRPNRPNWLADLRDPFRPPEVTTVQRQIIKISFAGINGILFDQATGPIYTGAYDPTIIYEMEFHNTAIHPTHMHLQHMQVVTPNGCGGLKEGEFYDTATTTGPGICTVRTRWINFSGIVIMHCHVLDHEDMGILGYIWVPFKAAGSFEAGPRYSQNTKPGICCKPRLDPLTGAEVCRGVPQCGGTVGVNTCNQPCSVPLNLCPATKPYCSTTGVCFATTKSANGEPLPDGASACTTPVYPYIVMAIGLAVAAVAVISAVYVIRSRGASYSTILIEEMKQESLHVPTRNYSPFPSHQSPRPPAC